MPSKAMSPEELEEQRLRMAEASKHKRSVLFEMDGNTVQFELYFALRFKTNGGMMFDITVTYDSKETTHRYADVCAPRWSSGPELVPGAVCKPLALVCIATHMHPPCTGARRP